MDFAAARAKLVSETRARFGLRVTIRPWRNGEMKGSADPMRAVIENIAARIDFLPDPAKLGGSDRAGPLLLLSGDNPTLTIPRAALAYLPDHPYRVEVVAVGASGSAQVGQVYEIMRASVDGNGIAVFTLSLL